MSFIKDFIVPISFHRFSAFLLNAKDTVLILVDLFCEKVFTNNPESIPPESKKEIGTSDLDHKFTLFFI